MTPLDLAETTTQRDRIRSLVAANAPTDRIYDTPLDGVRLFRVSAPVERVPGVYNPSVCIIVEGSKHAYHNGRTHLYNPDQYLCTTLPTPVEAEIPHATLDAPVLGVLIDLETRALAELMLHYHAVNPRPSSQTAPPDALAVAAWDDTFTVALLRCLELLDDSAALDLLGRGRLRELLYTIIEGPAGPSVRNTLGAPTNRLAPVLTYMRDNLDQALAVEDLADRAGMSRAAFDRQFKATTSLSPLKYLKALRLNDAAILITNGTNITDASARVGYASASQFSREFKRHFGATPRSWANTAGDVDRLRKGP